MDTLKVVTFCPIREGLKCTEVKVNPNTNEIEQHRCNWFTKMVGIDPQTGENVDTWKCNLSWMPILMVENSAQQIRTGAAVESLREETIKRQDTLIKNTLLPFFSEPKLLSK